MTRESTDIKLVVPPMPKVVRNYIKSIAPHSPRGRDGEFCSPWTQEKLDDFGWEAHGLEKPSLIVFSRWFMTVCKQGGVGKGKRRKSIECPKVPKKIRDAIIAEVEGHCVITDSFLGSNIELKIFAKYNSRHDISHAQFANILISRRKRTPSKTGGVSYFYQPAPITRPYDVKVGFSTRDPHIRMEEETRNTRGENPKMLALVYGSKADEGRTLKELEDYKIPFEECGNKEMFRFHDMQIIFDFIKSKIEERGGKFFIKY